MLTNPVGVRILPAVVRDGVGGCKGLHNARVLVARNAAIASPLSPKTRKGEERGENEKKSGQCVSEPK